MCPGGSRFGAIDLSREEREEARVDRAYVALALFLILRLRLRPDLLVGEYTSIILHASSSNLYGVLSYFLAFFCAAAEIRTRNLRAAALSLSRWTTPKRVTDFLFALPQPIFGYLYFIKLRSDSVAARQSRKAL